LEHVNLVLHPIYNKDNDTLNSLQSSEKSYSYILWFKEVKLWRKTWGYRLTVPCLSKVERWCNSSVQLSKNWIY